MLGQPHLHPTAQAMMTQGRGGMHQPLAKPLNSHAPAYNKPALAPQPQAPQVVGVPVAVPHPVPVLQRPAIPPQLLPLLLGHRPAAVMPMRPAIPPQLAAILATLGAHR